MKASERDAWCKNQYDTTLQLLQRRLANGNNQIREEVLNILSKKAASELDLSTHTALLDLSMNSEKRMRLVTTNFDRFFQYAADLTGTAFNEFKAPALSVPKHGKWDGIVYLHGLLPESFDEFALNQIVLGPLLDLCGVEVLIRVIESTSESSDEVWENRVPPLIRLILGGVDNATSSLSESLARLIITSGSQFANALNQVKHWLSIVDQPYRIIRKMNENGICRDFPLESLTLLKLIIPKVLMPATYLGSCLDMIRSADGTLVEDDRYVDLKLLVDRFS